MQLHEFTSVVEQVFPIGAAMPGDPVGLQVASHRRTAKRILVAYEVTDQVVLEAERMEADCILAFHPLIYTPLTTLGTEQRVQRLVRRLIRADIALVIAHTNVDAHPMGTSKVLAQRLGFDATTVLQPSAYPGYGMGILASLQPAMSFDVVVERVVACCGGPVKYTRPHTDQVHSVAIVAGSGMSFLDLAIDRNADVLITADVKYHGFHEASGVIGLIDPGHFEMEQFVPQTMSELLTPLLPAGTLTVSQVCTNPVQYQAPSHQESFTTPTGSV